MFFSLLNVFYNKFVNSINVYVCLPYVVVFVQPLKLSFLCINRVQLFLAEFGVCFLLWPRDLTRGQGGYIERRGTNAHELVEQPH